MHAGNLSISMGSCMEREMSELTCRSNSTILVWIVDNQSVSGLHNGFTATTVPEGNGLLVSTLAVNTSMYLTRLGIKRIQCYNEKSEENLICIRFNGRCMSEVNCDVDAYTTDRKVST